MSTRCVFGLFAILLAGALPAQTVTLSLRDGNAAAGEVVRLSGAGAEANLVLRLAEPPEGGPEERSFPLSRVLALHGRGPIGRPPAAIVYLVGGDRLTGELRGGDAAGETFTVASRSLGPIDVPVDRLRAIVFPERAGAAGPEDLRMPDGSDEALFRRAERGFDTIVGGIHRFTASGVQFEWSAAEDARLYPYDTLVGIALRGGEPAAESLPAHLLTRSGDVVQVALRGIEDGRLQLACEGDRAVAVPFAEVSCLTFRGADRVFLSDLQPTRVEESAHDLGDAAPLHPWQRDRCAPGGFLQVGGLGYGKGIGVAGRSTLVYEVPAGTSRFLAHVGIDDAISRLEVRGQVAAQIRLGDEVVWGPIAVRAGDPPHVVNLDVEPGAALTLEVDLGEGWFLGDWLDWANAVFLR